jgi:hypothetical protein
MGEKSRGNWRVSFCALAKDCIYANVRCDICWKTNEYASVDDIADMRGADDCERRLTIEGEDV